MKHVKELQILVILKVQNLIVEYLHVLGKQHLQQRVNVLVYLVILVQKFKLLGKIMVMIINVLKHLDVVGKHGMETFHGVLVNQKQMHVHHIQTNNVGMLMDVTGIKMNTVQEILYLTHVLFMIKINVYSLIMMDVTGLKEVSLIV